MGAVYSMTAFARQTQDSDWGSLTWEIRSVNHRYLELSMYLPEGLRYLEEASRELVRRSLGRGKVECSLRFEPKANFMPNFKMNMALVEQLVNCAHQLEAVLKTSSSLRASDVLRWPGVLSTGEADFAQLEQVALPLLERALQSVKAAREREGAALVQVLEQRLGAIDVQLALLQARLPVIMQLQHTRLQMRVKEMSVELDPQRLEQEVGLIAQKADVDEEIERLKTHVAEVRRLVQDGGAVGRRLDFLLQELNREANTLASKSVHLDTTQVAIELKVLIEQMREQIQNIE